MAGSDVSRQDRAFLNSLRTAVSAGDFKTVRRLVKGGVDVNRRYWFDGTLLHEAVFSGSTDIVKLLLQAKAEVNSTNKDGRTALHLAARSGNEEICGLLLKAGANPDLLSSDGRSCLHVAAWKDHMGICRQLVKAGCDVNQRDEDGWTPLFWAVSGSMELTRLLMEHGAQLDIQDKRGHDPLMIALISKNKSMVAYLLREGADQQGTIENFVDKSELLDCICRSDIHDAQLIQILLTKTGRRTLPKGYDHVKYDKKFIGSRIQTLQTCCRSVIRAKLYSVHRACSITPAILELPLPGHVKDFLTLSELLQDR